MAVLKCPCSTFSNVIFKQMPRSHWFLSINSQQLQPYWLLQQTSEHTKLQRYKVTKLQRYKATKIHTLTPLTYELFFQNSSKIKQQLQKKNKRISTNINTDGNQIALRTQVVSNRFFNNTIRSEACFSDILLLHHFYFKILPRFHLI